MATKTGKDLEDLQALLGEVQALRQDVEAKGAELRREWGPAAERAESRVVNLSHYIALRSHDLTDLQLDCRPEACLRWGEARPRWRRRSTP